MSANEIEPLEDIYFALIVAEVAVLSGLRPNSENNHDVSGSSMEVGTPPFLMMYSSC